MDDQLLPTRIKIKITETSMVNFYTLFLFLSILSASVILEIIKQTHSVEELPAVKVVPEIANVVSNSLTSTQIVFLIIFVFLLLLVVFLSLYSAYNIGYAKGFAAGYSNITIKK
jgi:hypothetical protein